MKILGYTNEPCIMCERLRVELYEKKDGELLHICEKCKWCKELNAYVFEPSDEIFDGNKLKEEEMKERKNENE